MAHRRPSSPSDPRGRDTMTLRIIGGSLRGRRLRYQLDRRTRPMKDRIRQAIFNLIGPAAVPEVVVWDLFAGTGLLALEAISRGAACGVAIERTPWLAEQLRRHRSALGLQDRLQVVVADAFRRVDLLTTETDRPWLVFICPPYSLFHERREELLQMIATIGARAPFESTIVVEFDDSFDASLLPTPGSWRTRRYRPTVVAWQTKVSNQVDLADLSQQYVTSDRKE